MLKKLSQYRPEIAINLLALSILMFLHPVFTYGRMNSYSLPHGNFNKPVFRAAVKPISQYLNQPGLISTKHLSSAGEPRIEEPKAEKHEPKHDARPTIGGPGQPEMGAFKSVNADNAVDLFSGDFSYNIPLLDVGGYPVNLIYNGNVTMDQEASWVGLGFNINPGTIMRNMRGVPDDFDGTDSIRRMEHIKPDKTWGLSVGARTELFGFDPLQISANGGISFNNQRGLALEFSVNPSVSISGNVGDDKTASLSFSANLKLTSNAGASITPSIALKYGENQGVSGNLSLGVGYNSRVGLQSLHMDAEVSKSAVIEKNQLVSGSIGALNSSISFAYPSVTPSIRTRLTRKNFSVNITPGTANVGFLTGTNFGGFYTESKIADEDVYTAQPAYGMLFLQNGNNDEQAMLDFNRLNDGVYTNNTPAIAVPVYTYDVFSISGEGTGGSFRAYRGDLGFVRDAKTTTRDDGAFVSAEFGAGYGFHGGVDLERVLSPNTAGPWKQNNTALSGFQFRNANADYQSVYFKNPGEKAIPDANYQAAIGGEDLVRLKMAGQSSGTPTLLPTFERFNDQRVKGADLGINTENTMRKRDKRTQVITCLTAEEATYVGFDKKIFSYDPNYTGVIFGRCDNSGISSYKRYNSLTNDFDNYRKRNHISEIDVVNDNGMRYIYGLPVYNTKQVDVTFNIENGNSATGLSSYSPDVDDSKDNAKGKDNFIQREEMPAYVHSFLLTELLSPDYVDVKGDGITEDDKGDAVKFNYSRFEKGIKWRTPVDENKATWNENLKSDNKDDKAHYIYGEREQWYLYSIESKNMVARFYLASRDDDKQVNGAHGGIDNSWGAQRLQKISLFSKADLIKLGANAKPIKTIFFEYDYSLCKNAPGSPAGTGKLTLKSLYFTFNGNDKTVKNRYRFSYESNPDYDYNANDRWGTYKPDTNNPDNLVNADFPYTEQNKTNSDIYAAAWALSEIKLPSGGKMDISYEADDYAYVQDRKAAGMYQVIGFGTSATPNSTQLVNARLYTQSEEYEYVYLQVPYAVSTLEELRQHYFNSKGSQLYLKLAVTMPTDGRGGGSELIPMYVDYDNYGIISGTPPGGGSYIYVHVKRLESGETPMVQYALQYMKNFLPSKAFPGYDVKEEMGLRSIIMALSGLKSSFSELVKGGNRWLRGQHKCENVVTERSFARLTNPYFVKYGGGNRVKKIVISDNWNKLSGGYDATYGQEYKYTTTETVGATTQTISSGVASWEPAIGGDENPHREILRFLDRNKGGPYDYGAVELPITEMFYPSASVGYSRVEVLSIHRDTVKNAPGKTVTEFYTTKDFPTKSDYTSLADPSANVQYKPKAILQLLKIDLKQQVTLSQGFRVVLNDMNGKVKSQSTFSAFDNENPLSRTVNYYNVVKDNDNTYTFKDVFPTLSSPDGVVHDNLIGRDVEIMTDFREHRTETVTSNVHFNLDFIPIGFIPISIPTLLAPTFYESNTFRSSSVLKVVNHYGILDSVVVMDKGSIVSTKNTVYDAETGNALVTRTNNEYNQPLYTFSYPAHWAYDGMGPAYRNIDVTYEHLVFRNGLLETPINLDLLQSGDEIYVMSESSRGPVGKLPCDPVVSGSPFYLPKSNTHKIWAVNTAGVGSLTPQFVFMDAEGNAYTADDVKIRIVRSGRRNLLDQGVGGVTTLYNPVRSILGNNFIVLDDATGVLNTSSVSFKDHWRVDDVLYRKDSLVTIPQYARIHRLDFFPDTIFTMSSRYLVGKPVSFSDYEVNPSSVLVRSRRPFLDFTYTDDWIKFYITPGMLPTGSVIYKGMLSLPAHVSSPPDEDIGTGHTVNGALLHTASWSHDPGSAAGLQNQVAIRRVRTSWPTNNTEWNTLFTDRYHTLHDWNQYSVVPATPVHSNASRILSYSPLVDTRIDITGIARDMVAAIRTPGNTEAPAIRLMKDRADIWGQSESLKSSGLAFQCYMNELDNRYRPSMSLYFYVCGDTTHATPHPGLYFPGDPLQDQMIVCNDTTLYSMFCLSKFRQRRSMNPYVEGVWGNWRVDSAFVYYSSRKETSTSSAVDLRTGGVIDDFKPFWSFGTRLTRDYSAANVWVWNSVTTQYNRKGFQLETKDALGRFSSGLYGYNQQLPIAVANNARYREILFDGFEDYDYSSASCSEVCAPRRHYSMTGVEGNLDITQKHTGKYSLRVSPAGSASFTAPVLSEADANADYWMRVRVDSTDFSDTIVNPNGHGFRGTYYNYYCSGGWVYPTISSLTGGIVRHNEQINMQCGKDDGSGCPGDPSTGLNGPISAGYQCSSGIPPVGINTNFYAVKWEGRIQATETGNYYFRTIADDGVRVYVDGSLIIDHWTEYLYSSQSTANLFWLKGSDHEIRVEYFEAKHTSKMVLYWKTPTAPDFSMVPANVVYQPESVGDLTGTITYNTKWCTKFDYAQVRGNALTDTFSLIQGRKMILSAWVKEGGDDCKCGSYAHNSIGISFAGDATTYTLHPTGNIIEGWQRYESVFTVPASATSVTVGLNNSHSGNVYFDDLRILPFNATMKSFVYHPSSLRLMSEIDENNYASFYEYDDDGTLIRVKKETERGIKTISETRSALQKSDL